MKKNEIPVPGRGRIVIALICVMLMTASISFAAERTLPWNITVDGENVAMVESKEAAREVMQEAADEYADGEVMDIEIVEETEAEQLDIEQVVSLNEMSTVEEAEEKLLDNITVITTEEITEQEPIEYQQEYRPDPDLYVGEEKVETEGKEGTKEITRKIIKENGRQIEEEVVDETVVEEPTQEVILTGTKQYDGYGGGEISHSDEGVSYDPDAVYAKLQVPVDQVYVSSHFGPRWGKVHRGTDFALAQGSSIYAADDGKVYFSGEAGSYGNLVKVDHGNGMQTYYAHCSQLLAEQGQEVKKGEKIALVGSTGNSTGPHLHFEVIINGVCVDPVAFLDIT